MESERRTRRSEYRDQSLRYWFASAADRDDLLGFVLADQSGLLIASNLPAAAAEEVAAQTPFLHGNEPLLKDLTDDNRFAVKVHPLTIGSSSAYLCVIGREEVSPNSLAIATGGIKRIMNCN